ncbi:hypothetical protein UFOVP1196_38 [uncultured Caudovirales phage]|uniref:Uncharacterized protein n=1 Tax=uncultured Caudovirales phage TaxID=2100421 RepID=A0A6J5R918_9CAUD|nr:hypothetical protein UFOVP1196_38 [uncultured Caudovirales phage]
MPIRQRPLKGGRVTSFSALDPAIRAWAESEAARSDCHVSFVINNALSVVSGVEIFETLAQARKRTRKTR